jgi:hypothetical protein
MTKFGFTRNKADHGVYVKGKGKDWISVALYVDDLLIISANDSEVSKVKKCLSSVFKMKDLGLVEYFLGMKFTKLKLATISTNPSTLKRFWKFLEWLIAILQKHLWLEIGIWIMIKVSLWMKLCIAV